MSALKIIAFLLGIGLAAVSFKALTRQEPPPPSNECVHENNFDRLRSGMTEAQVEAILGFPHKTIGGEIVQLERPGMVELQGTIQVFKDKPDCSRLKVYQGPDNESIEVLFSEKDATVLAAEYHVCDYAVMYRGPRVAKRSQELVAIATNRIVGTAETQKRSETVARYQRRKMLEKRPNTFFNPESSPPTNPPTSDAMSSPASPVVASLPLSSEEPSPIIQTSIASATPLDRPAHQVPAPQNPTAGRKASNQPSGPMKIKLPSGKILSESVPKFDLPRPWPDKIFPHGATVYVEQKPNKAIQGVYMLKKPKLHGPAVTLHDNGRIETVAFYADGRLHGPLRIWTDQKQRLVYAEYRNGKKHGLTCLFSETLPWLIQEWDSASLQQEYLVQYIDGLPAIVSPSELAGAEAEEFARAKDRLGTIEQKMRDNEITYKRNLVDWNRQEAKKAKQPVARPTKVQPPLPNARLQAPNASTSRQLEMQWRTALTRSMN